MTDPREFLPNTTYLITRRCTQRMFLLKPTKRTSQIFLYCLAYAAMKYDVVIHAVCVLSNHYHIVVSDPGTRVAEFYGWLNEYVAKVVNASYGRFEYLWDSRKPSVVTLEDNDAVLNKTIYTLTNPVSAGLVASGEKWPGIWLYKRSHSQTIERPDVYFREDGDMPEIVKLEITPPLQFRYLGYDNYEQLVTEKLVEKSAAIRETMISQDRSFLSARDVMKQHPFSTPWSREKRFGMRPKIATKNKWLRTEAIQRQKKFVSEYREALERWQAGEKDVPFPAGTYLMRIRAGVKCRTG